MSADAAEGAAHDLRLKPLPEETIFHLQADRAAERIEAEDRIIRENVGSIDGLRRNQIPIDGVAKSLVDANAVLIDGKALRACLAAARRRSLDSANLGKMDCR